jgi:signal transduction histidine kinase/ligand-binding sensor domain-containing protein
MNNPLSGITGIILALLSVIISPLDISGQAPLWFRSDNDISSSLIKQLFIDSKDMLWVATEDGLNRFDGSKFTIYRNNKNDSLSVASNILDCIFEDSKGNLFVSSFNGVQLYDYGKDKFSPIGRTADGKPVDGNITSLIELPDGQLWALGRTPMRLEITPDRHILLHKLNLPKDINLISKAVVDRDGGIWMTKSSEGIFYRDRNGIFKKYLGKPGDPVIISVTLDNDGNIYAGCINSGLYRFDRERERFIHISDELKGISIKHLSKSPEGKIMVGTDKDGLYEYDPATGESSLVSIPYMNSKKAKVHSIAYDKFGNRWMGIFQKGLLLIPPSSVEFKRLTSDNPGFYSLNSTCVNAIFEDCDGTLWIGTDNDGIYKFDHNRNPLLHLTRNVPPIVTGIMEDSSGRLWITSYGDGVGTIDKATGQYHPVRLIDKAHNDVKHSFGMVKDHDGNLWISTMGSGLFKMDGKTGIITSQQLTEDDILWIPTIHYSERGNLLFLGSYAGLHIVNLTTGTEKAILPARIVYAVTESTDGNHWIGTSEGLAQLDADGNLMRIFNTADGLPSSTIYSVAEADGAIWAGSSMGISKITPGNGTIQNYTVDDGLQCNEFSRNAVAMGHDSTLYFGGINGLTYFNPRNINPTGRKRDVRISDFYLNGIPVRTETLSGGKQIIDRPIFETDNFSLSHHDNSFAIEFTTSDPMGTSQVEYWYAFDNDEWIKTEAGSPRPSIGKALLNFSDIPYGKHKLRIKVIDNGVESDIRTLSIDVRPAWYQTIWAKILYLLLIILVFTTIAIAYIQEQRRKQKEMELDHVAQMNESRIQFLVNISHDIRTPMSLIIDPLRRLIAENKDGEHTKVYNLMLRNANRIMHLVNEVMDFRKIEKGKMQMTIREVRAAEFINELVELFRPVANNKDIDLSFSHPGCDDIPMWVDCENFDKVMMNLLSNAIKYTPKGGNIHVSLYKSGDSINIAVSDTGVGVPASEREKIFDRFYQAPNHMTGGTGVGLHITNALVKLHGGGISVKENKEAGKGTVFTVTLPANPPQNLPDGNSRETISHPVANEIEMPPFENIPMKEKRCLVRKSVDRQIQHFLVKCVKKTKNSGTNLRFRQSMPGTAAEKVSVRLTRNTILRSGHCLQ